jgi:hypothetical protein
MNITNPNQCIQKWESDLIKTCSEDFIPEQERARIICEIDALYNEMYDLLCFTQSKGILPNKS